MALVDDLLAKARTAAQNAETARQAAKDTAAAIAAQRGSQPPPGGVPARPAT